MQLVIGPDAVRICAMVVQITFGVSKKIFENRYSMPASNIAAIAVGSNGL